MKRKTLHIIGGVMVIAVFAVGLVWLARPRTQPIDMAKGQLHVVAAENFWGNIAVQLGAGHVQVVSIITDPNTDPHLYDSNAQDAAEVAAANVVIINGLGYDDFMGKLVDASRNSSRTVLTAADTMQASKGADQHLWYDIPHVGAVASSITEAYIAEDPTHASDYRRSLAILRASLQPIEGTISTIKQRYAGTPVAYTEPVPSYLLQAAGLAVKTPEGFAKSIEDGDDPSPADTGTMDALMTTKSVRVLIYNAQATSPVTEHVKQLASQAGIPIVGVTETLPANEQTYQSWMQDQLNALLDALGA